jgi:hypothetical protein
MQSCGYRSVLCFNGLGTNCLVGCDGADWRQWFQSDTDNSNESGGQCGACVVPPDADLVGQPVRVPWVDVTINSNTFEYEGAANPVVADPATIQVGVDNTNTYYLTPISVYATVQVTDNEPQFSPSTAVVIPSDATGPVQIVLESSPDLVNWTSVLPGTYGSSATNRFFRVRAIRQ